MKIITNPSTFIAILVSLVVLSIFIFGVKQDTYAAGVDLEAPAKQTQPYNGDLKDNPIIDWIEFFINLLTVVIISGAAVMIAVAGVQYTSARDNSQSVQAAKDKIFNVLLGLLAYMFLYGFVQWLIPGGVF
jgi:hypothetical protein